MAVLTPARSALARAGATRAGYPIAQGLVMPIAALSGASGVRAGRIRANVHSTQPFVSVNGVQVATARLTANAKVLDGSLTVADILNATPNTASMRVKGFVAVEGQGVIVTLGSINNLTREFAGSILSSNLGYVGTPANFEQSLNLIDYTWGLNKRKVTGYYHGSATTIAQSLISTYAPGYTSLNVVAGLPTVDGGITFTEQDLTACLTQLAQRIGGDWYCDYDKDVHLFFADTSATDPTILNAIHPTLTLLSMSRDLSQVVTRVYVEGGGVNAFATCAVGETILPLEGDPTWYSPTGGTVKVGAQHVTYTGVQPAVGGGLVGTGAAPSGAPVLALASGAAGVETGPHTYGVTFVTAGGESIVSPLAVITTSVEAAPASAPTAAAPTIGTGPNPGSHDYAVTFVTTAGETTAGPSVTQATTVTPAPAGSPTPGTPTVGAGVTDGDHDYAVTFITAIGETTPSGISAQATAGPMAAPASAPTVGTATAGTGPETGSHDYAVTFVNAAGETTAGPSVTKVTDTTIPPAAALTADTPVSGTGSVTVGSHDYAVTFVTATGETPAGPSVTRTMAATLDPPASALTAAAPTAGGSIDAGSHDYVVTFVTATGETTGGTTSAPATTGGSVVVGYVTPPASGATISNNLAFSTLDYSVGDSLVLRVTYVNGYGETTIGSASNTLTAVGSTGSPSVAAVFDMTSIPVSGDGTVTAKRVYLYVNGTQTWYHEFAASTTTGTWFTRSAGTPPGTNTAALYGAANTIPLTAIPTGAANVTARKVYRRFNSAGTFKLVTTIANNSGTTYTDTTANSGLGADAPSSNTATLQRIPLTAIPTGTSEVTSRNVYRTAAGGSQLKLLTTIANNVGTTFTDTVADASLGANIPVTNTAVLNVNHLTAIPTGPTSTTSRKVYRTAIGSAQLKLLATIANNSTTTLTDSTIDASLGANVPTSNTAAMNQIPLTAIPLGDANVTSRKLYRRSGGAGLKLLATLADNTTTTYLDVVANGSLGAAVPVTSTAYLQRIALSAIPIGGTLVTSRKVYRTAAGGTQLKLLATLADNTTTVFADTVTDASLGANVPTTNTAAENTVALSAIPIGSATVTKRRLYRTAVATFDTFGAPTNNPAQLKLLHEIADNTTATYTDSLADGSLTTNVPTSDTSGLAQPTGNVLAGSAALQVASIGPFPTAGWAVIGNGQQVVRYTGISGQLLTGIPSSGAGAIAATIAFNSTVTSAPQLTGIPASGAGSILYAVLKGDSVNLFEQVDDVPAQTALAALIGGDGIQEDSLQDRRLAKTEARARGTAQLALKKDVLVAIHFQTRDINTRAGRTIRVNLGAPFNLVMVDFLIQHVAMSAFAPAFFPTCDATASSIRYTFDDLLRSLAATH